MRSRVFLLAFVCGVLLLAGCGGPELAPVKGRVMWKSKAVAGASITFSPVGKSADEREPGKPATGFTDSDGNFKLSTYKVHDGALIGQHKVTITVDDANPVKCPRRTEITREIQAGDNDVLIELK